MDYHAEFNKIMKAHAYGNRPWDVFADWCRASALSLEKAVCKMTFDEKGAERCEREYAEVANKYNDFNLWAGEALGITVMALDMNREEFLGRSLEALGMGNKNNGQFLTPNCVARVMSELCCDRMEHKPGEIVTLNDQSCGASVCMIEGAEKLINDGVNQRDILIDVGDIDKLSCDISYIELTYLGYAAIVRHQNALSLENLSKPRLTLGWYLHGMNYRYRKEAA